MAFSVSGTQIIDANGQPFIPRGINIYAGSGGPTPPARADNQLLAWGATAVTSMFPGINFVRVNVFDFNANSASALQSVVQQLTSQGIVVELEDHNYPNVATGSDLTAAAQWYASVASAFKNNPYVWFGTQNEPNPNSGDVNAEVNAVYQAIRGTGNNSIIMINQDTPYGLNLSGMSNVVWDQHFYNNNPNSSDYSAVQASLNSVVATDQSVAHIPVVIGEYGPSSGSYGAQDDPSGNLAVQAVEASGLGSAAWAWTSGAPTFPLLLNDPDGNPASGLSQFGQTVEQYIAAGASAGSTTTSGTGGTTTVPISNGSTPAGATRDPSQIPFASDSVWNLPLGTGAQWQYNAQLAGAGIYVNTNGNYNENIYTSSASDPVVTVTSGGSWGVYAAGTWTLHMPANAVPAGPTPGDQWITVDDTTTNTWYSFGYFNWTSATTATANAGSADPIYGNGLQDHQGKWDGGVGTLRASDLAAGTINHTLRIEVPTTMLMSWDPNSVTNLAPYSWPNNVMEDGFANGGGVPPGLTAYTGTIPWGVTIGIAQGVQEPTDVAANPGADMLWRALQTHGAMVRDSTAPYGNSLVLQTDQNVDQSNPLIQGMEQFGNEILSHSQILANQGPNSVNGGGTPVVPLDPPLSGAPVTSPPTTTPPIPATTTGTGADSLALKISEDAYANGDGTSDAAGDATFTVAIDGKQQGGTFTAAASHAAGADQTFTFNGYFGTGNHTVMVNFLNDAWGGTGSSGDRNLYIDGVTYKGTNTNQSAALYSNGSQNFAISGGSSAAKPSPDGTKITTASASPIMDKSGNAWSLVQSASNGLQIAVNGTVDPVTANVVLLETLGGKMVQENTSGNWYSEPGAAGPWSQITAPLPVPVAGAPVTTGSGSDTLVLSISEDAYANKDGTSDAGGDAAFTVSVDGKQLAGTFYATAQHATGASQNFTFKGDWAPGAHTVAVQFLNDAWGGTASTDRNLYVNDVTYDGTDTKQSATLYATGSHSFGVTDSTPLPQAVIGAGSDSLVLKVSEDAYLGNAQFTVAVDGKQLGGTFTATTLHSSGNSQTLAFASDFGAGQHTVAVNFLNDAWGGTASTDRNLYVNDIVYNGTDTHQSATLYGAGPRSFPVSGGTTPSVSETGDHGSLQKNLSQAGSYSVGGDTFVLSSGNAAAVTLGTGVSQIKFVGPGSATVTGGAGQATITADTGNNKFVAGAGSLDVTGGAGKDAYVFHAGGGLLTLEDFSLAKGDTLTIDKSLQGSLHQMSDGRGGTMLTFGTDTTHGVDLHGVASVSSSNVLWA